MSPSSKLVSNNSRTFLKVAIALVFISKLQQEKALQEPTVARTFLIGTLRLWTTVSCDGWECVTQQKYQ